MIRNTISVILGLCIAIAVFLIAENINSHLFPLANNIDLQNVKAIEAFYQSQPITFWLIVWLGWMLGSFVCGLIIKLISKKNNKKLPMIAGIILTLSAIANFFAFPHPTWFVVIGLITFIPSTILGFNLVNKNNHVQ